MDVDSGGAGLEGEAPGTRGDTCVLSGVRARIDTSEDERRADLETTGGVGHGRPVLLPGVREAGGRTSLAFQPGWATCDRGQVFGLATEVEGILLADRHSY